MNEFMEAADDFMKAVRQMTDARDRLESIIRAQVNSATGSRLDDPVGVLGLSVRSTKAMRRMGIATVGQLINKTVDDFDLVKGFGQTSLSEVRAKLRAIGLDLKGGA